jgi:membrane associated rhomboid family serine protease
VWWVLSYVLGAVVGGLAYVWVCDVIGSPGSVVGASGAIFSLLGTYFVMLSGARRKLPDGDWRKAALSRARTSVLRLVAFNIIYGLVSYGVANESHIGGLVVGLIIGLFAL